MIALILSLLIQPIWADENMAYVICKNKSIVRTIQVDWVDEEKACLTLYSKNGKAKEVGRASNKPYCNKVINNIKTNLEAAGWKCRDVSKNIDVISS